MDLNKLMVHNMLDTELTLIEWSVFVCTQDYALV